MKSITVLEPVRHKQSQISYWNQFLRRMRHAATRWQSCSWQRRGKGEFRYDIIHMHDNLDW